MSTSPRPGRVRGATRYKDALDRIVQNASYWKHPPKDTPKRVREIRLGDTCDVEIESEHLESPVKVEHLPGQARQEIVPSFAEIFAKALPPVSSGSA